MVAICLHVFLLVSHREVDQVPLERLTHCKNRGDVFALLGSPDYRPGERSRNVFNAYGGGSTLGELLFDEGAYTWVGRRFEICVRFDAEGNVVSSGKRSLGNAKGGKAKGAERQRETQRGQETQRGHSRDILYSGRPQ
jgi:hypothetical protein